jgi:predicted HTH transcriptional regulator
MSSYSGHDEKPEVLVSSGAFKIVLPKQDFSSKPSSKNETKSNETEKRENIVFSILKDHKPHSRKEIETELGVSISTTRRLLQQLLDSKQIIATGSRKNVRYLLA